MDLTDEQWAMLEPLLLPDPPKRADGRGRQWRQAREVLDGVLWVLRPPKAERLSCRLVPLHSGCH